MNRKQYSLYFQTTQNMLFPIGTKFVSIIENYIGNGSYTTNIVVDEPYDINEFKEFIIESRWEPTKGIGEFIGKIETINKNFIQYIYINEK